MLCLCFFALAGCQKNDRSDGYGNFEATEIIVSSEANGKLELLNVEEGSRMAAGSVAAVVDTMQLHSSAPSFRRSVVRLWQTPGPRRPDRGAA